MSKFKSFAASAFALIATLGVLDAKQVIAVFPAGWGGYISAFLSGCAVIAHLYAALSKTFTPTAPAPATSAQRLVPLLLIAAALATSLLATSCAGVVSGVTGEKIASAAVQRTDGTGKPFNVAKADIDRAEANPDQVYGLYNAGRVADLTADLKKSSEATSSIKPSVEAAPAK